MTADLLTCASEMNHHRHCMPLITKITALYATHYREKVIIGLGKIFQAFGSGQVQGPSSSACCIRERVNSHRGAYYHCVALRLESKSLGFLSFPSSFRRLGKKIDIST